jgi:HK97 family phage prohead protease
MINFDNPASATFEVDAETRTIRGLALPFNTTAKSGGRVFQFAKGTVTYGDISRVKLLVAHDPSRAVGYATEIEETDDGLFMAFKVARGAAGDEALTFAEDRVWDGLSVGIGDDAKWSNKEGVFHAVNAPLMETSLTPFPAYSDARLTSVAAQSDDVLNTKENTMTEQVADKTEERSVDMSAVVADAIKAGFAGLANEGPELVTPVARFEVNEAPLYRFDGGKGQHEFSTDLINASRGDKEAEARAVGFMKEAFGPKFDVDTGNVSTLNPTRQRPDMYVDQRKFTTPLYDALNKGTLADITPFSFPRFNSASGLVAPHVEGVEPTPGAFTATSQTVTPSAMSGKVEITREVWDQGGNPQVSGLIWNKMVYAYYQALETAAVAVLDAASPTQIALTTAASDSALVNQLEAALADLNFVAGGNTFNFAATQQDLYRKLAAAVDSTGRKLLPILGPTNANGQARPNFRSLDVAGTEFAPVWSLGAAGSVSESSYLVDTSSVHVWNTAPQRLEFQYRVAYVDLAIWGYVATAISDINGVREITYDPVA